MVMEFGARKLESCGYQVLKTDRRTDRQTRWDPYYPR